MCADRGARRFSIMPELPEVETVRRGLSRAMTGARISARRPAPPGPALSPSRALSPSGWRGGGRGARPARQISAGRSRRRHGAGHASRHDGLVPGRAAAGGDDVPGAFHHARGDDAAARPRPLPPRERASTVTYNDPRRFGFMTLVARRELDAHPLFRAIGVEPLGNAFDGAAWRGSSPAKPRRSRRRCSTSG